MGYFYLGFLCISSFWDIRIQKIPAIWLYAGAICSAIHGMGQLVEGRRSPQDLVIALLPAIVCYFLAVLTKTVGEGDAWLLLCAGFGFSCKRLFIILYVACLLSVLGGVVIFVRKRRIQNQKIPYAPFLSMATGLLLIAEGV